ncbi:MAG: peptidyl-tRNA hydrolase [Thermoplasmata archaeon]|jgi:PTH2 family peptidyl-tRNA hydrolase|nr:MAG: peptidyl-tRNA hydrolase [Thermoplasmata archaeon]RLF64540.1 MAG: peptidyl-tRNA hydrolase [Thermoplasmata archaeon]
MHKMAIIVNDIPMSAGKMAAQVAHAAVECTLKTQKKNPSLLKKWLDEGQKKVVLKAYIDDIESLKKKADSMGLCTSLIHDAGLTELEPGTPTALAIGPAEESKIDKITGQLPLK